MTPSVLNLDLDDWMASGVPDAAVPGLSAAGPNHPWVQAWFTQAACSTLAAALHDRTDWPVWLVWAENQPVHAVVQRPDGILFDVEGPTSADVLIDRYEADEVAPASPAQVSVLRTRWNVADTQSVRELAEVTAERLLEAFPVS